MRTENQERIDALWIILGSCMSAGYTVVLNMLVGHFLNLEEVGRFGLALATAQILYSLALFGANDIQVMDFGHRYRFCHYFGAKLFSTLLAAAACPLYLWARGIGREAAAYTAALTLVMLINSWAELYQGMFFQCRRLDLSGKASFWRYLICGLGFAAVFLWRRSILAACAGMLAADAGATLWWILRYSRRYRDSSYCLEADRTAALLRESLPLCLSVLIMLLINNGPKYLIDAYLTEAEQGAYTILFMPVYAINLLGQFIFRPYFPRYAESLGTDRKGFVRLLKLHGGVVAGFALAGSLAAWLVGIPLLKIFFGHDLGAYRGLLALFVLSGGLLAYNLLLYYIMVLLEEQKRVFVISLAAVAVTFLCGLVLVPRMSLAGAWLSFASGQICLMAGYMTLLIRYLKAWE